MRHGNRGLPFYRIGRVPRAIGPLKPRHPGGYPDGHG